jgi:hypothetical protein
MTNAATTTPAVPFVVVEGDLVRYAGSQVEQHGVWRVRGPVRFGEYAGRLIVENPDNERETLILSAGSTSLTRIEVAPAEQPDGALFAPDGALF